MRIKRGKNETQDRESKAGSSSENESILRVRTIKKVISPRR